MAWGPWEKSRSWTARHKPLTGIIAAAGSLIAAYLALEGIWSSVSQDPLIPGLWHRIKPWVDDGARVLALAALVAIAVSLFMMEREIVKASRRSGVPSEPPPGTQVLDGLLTAGTDRNVDLVVTTGIGSVTSAFCTATQGDRVIVRRKPMEIDAESSKLTLKLTARETEKLVDGFMLMETWTVTDGMVVPFEEIHAIRVRRPLGS